jgi:UDP-N-acetyl-D-mannosaminuronic acid dehydrogenase
MNSISDRPYLTSDNQKADVCIVGGGGHVGFPLALTFASKGLKVVVHDINESILETIAQGKPPFMERGAEPLLRQALGSGLLSLSTRPASVANAAAIVVTIGTPVDEFQNPVFKVMRECVDGLLQYLSDEQLVILRSTVYPGTTNWLDKYLLSQGKRLKVAFCPERVVQGLAIEEIRQYPQIVSGTTPEAECAAAQLFRMIAPEVVYLTPIEAEFAKLFSNAYRYIQFAVANQFYMMSSSVGVDYYRILEGMQKNYPRARDLPRAGFTAGPCLLKDTMQLASFFDNQFSLGYAAMLVNEGIALYLVERIAQKYPLDQITVGLLGMAFKADIDDTRASLSYKLKKVLQFRARAVLTTDPHVTTDPELRPLDVVLSDSDVLILCVPHSAYRYLETYDKPVVDIWGYLKKDAPIY